MKKHDTFYLLQTQKQQIIKLSAYAYFNKKTLESIPRKNIFIKYRTWPHNVKNIAFIPFAPGVYV